MSLLQKLPNHLKVENCPKHAALKAFKEVSNKTKDEENTLTVTEFLDDFTMLVWAVNTKPDGRVVSSRAYLVFIPCHDEPNNDLRTKEIKWV